MTFFSQNIQVKAINTLFMFIPLFTRQLHLGENVTVFTKTLPTFRQVHNTPAATLRLAYTFKEFRVDVALLSINQSRIMITNNISFTNTNSQT